VKSGEQLEVRIPVDPAKRPVVARAFAEDALAIASAAEAWGFEEDAARMRAWAGAVMARLPERRRLHEVAS